MYRISRSVQHALVCTELSLCLASDVRRNHSLTTSDASTNDSNIEVRIGIGTLIGSSNSMQIRLIGFALCKSNALS